MFSRVAVLVYFFVFIGFSMDAYAGYIKPGGGNDLIQIIISAVLTVLNFFKSIVIKIKSIFVKQ